MEEYGLRTYEPSYLRRGLREMYELAEHLHYEFVGYVKLRLSVEYCCAKLTKSQKEHIRERMDQWKCVLGEYGEPYYEPIFVRFFFNQRYDAKKIVRLWEIIGGSSIFSDFHRPVPWLPIDFENIDFA